MKISLSIKSKLTIWYLLISVVLIGLFSVSAYFLLSNGLKEKTVRPWEMRYAQIEKSADGHNVITGFLRLSSSNDTGSDQTTIMKSYSRDELMRLSSPEGIISIGDSILDKTVLDDLDMSEDYSLWFYSDISGSTTSVVAVTRSANEIEAILDTFSRILFIIGPIILILVCLLGYLVIKRSLHPVQVMASAVRDIKEHNLDKRLVVNSNDELGYLAATFNTMLARLEDAFKHEKQFTADASHELRSPLAVMQGEATLMLGRERSPGEYKKALENIYQETERMSSILKRLLFLARHEDHNQLSLVRLNLKELLEDLMPDMDILCEDKSISCQLNSPEDLFIKGDKIILRELFFNLIENAVRYTPLGGSIEITSLRENNYARIIVKDTGIGIPEEHLKHIFKRFYRVDKSRSRDEGGSGLGLSICHRIVELHNGTIEVESKTGTGTSFMIELPLSPES